VEPVLDGRGDSRVGVHEQALKMVQRLPLPRLGSRCSLEPTDGDLRLPHGESAVTDDAADVTALRDESPADRLAFEEPIDQLCAAAAGDRPRRPKAHPGASRIFAETARAK
jgi:hypothetical protein